MKTKVSNDHVFDGVAPSGGVVSGRGVLIGKLFGIAVITAAAGDNFTMHTRGQFDHAAEGAGSGQAFAVGEVAYWDDTNKRLTKTSSGNTRVGVAVAAKATTDTTLRVRLDGYVA